MSDKHELRLQCGLHITADVEPDEWAKIDAHYRQLDANIMNRQALWKCPLCGSDIDAQFDDRHDGVQEDTYKCEGDHDLWVTHITPTRYGMYHDVPEDEWKIIVETRL